MPIWWPGQTDPWQVPILNLIKQVLVIGIIKDDIEVFNDVMNCPILMLNSYLYPYESENLDNMY